MILYLWFWWCYMNFFIPATYLLFRIFFLLESVLLVLFIIYLSCALCFSILIAFFFKWNSNLTLIHLILKLTAPSAPPVRVRVTPKNATALTVNWYQPPLDTQNGRLSGYKVKQEFMYKISVIIDYFIINICLKINRKTTLDDESVLFNKFFSDWQVIYWKTGLGSKPSTPTVVPETEMVIYNLENYSNYTVRVLAYNTAGDGPYSQQVFGRTEQWSMYHLATIM